MADDYRRVIAEPRYRIMQVGPGWVAFCAIGADLKLLGPWPLSTDDIAAVLRDYRARFGRTDPATSA